MDPEVDRKVADHVLRMHRYQRPGYEVSFVEDISPFFIFFFRNSSLFFFREI